MGFFIGVLTYICSYFMLGPIFMSFYTTYNSEDNENSSRSLLIGVILTGIYISLWILIFVFLSKHIGWCIPGGIAGLICAIVTFNKNKEQTLINIDSDKSPINNNLKGTESLLSVIISEIKKNGINYLSEDNSIPYICQVMQYFDEEDVEFIIEEYNPNLNIKFSADTDIEITPLDYMVIIEKINMFKFLIKRGAKSSNIYRLAIWAIHQNLYNVLSCILEIDNFNINASLIDVIPNSENEEDLDTNFTLLDVAYAEYSHEKIISLLKSKGAKVGVYNNDNINDEKDILLKISNIYNGNVESFSKSELVNFAINLQSFKANLSNEKYKEIELKFKNYEKQKELKEYNKESFLKEITKLQDEFSKIAGKNVDFDGDIDI